MFARDLEQRVWQAGVRYGCAVGAIIRLMSIAAREAPA